MTTGRTVRGLLAALMLLVAVAGCGLPEDSQPRPIPDALADDLNPQGDQPAANPIAGEDWTVFVVTTDETTGEQRLFPFLVGGGAAPTNPELIRQLLLTRDEYFEDDPTLSNQIPPDVTLLDYAESPDRTTAILTLSEEFANVQAEAQKLAVAQLVYTATELGPADRVQFRLGEDGRSLDVPAGPENEQRSTVGRQAYDDLKPDLSD